MMKIRPVVFLLTIAVWCSAPAAAQTTANDAITDLTRGQTEAIVREYLLKNPEIIREALAALDAKETAERKRQAAVKLRKKQRELFLDASDPSAGNAAADVTIAVFFDYACGYCRKSLPGLNTLLENDPSVRIVYKEFPILSPASHKAALAALAAGRQGKYVEFHYALLSSKDLGDAGIKNIADDLGIDHKQLIKDMADPKLALQITKNAALANDLNINGVPAYVIVDEIIPGAIDAASLTKIVNKYRAQKKESDAEERE